jgi:hypothetical protein
MNVVKAARVKCHQWDDRGIARCLEGLSLLTLCCVQRDMCCISWRHSKLQLSRYVIKPQRHLISVAWA